MVLGWVRREIFVGQGESECVKRRTHSHGIVGQSSDGGCSWSPGQAGRFHKSWLCSGDLSQKGIHQGHLFYDGRKSPGKGGNCPSMTGTEQGPTQESWPLSELLPLGRSSILREKN